MAENSEDDTAQPGGDAPPPVQQRLSQLLRGVPLTPAVAVAVVLIVLAICIWLWEIPWLRPFLATAGAAVAAFAGPIPALLTPELRGKWLFAVVIAACTAAGVWFATEDLQQRLEKTAAANADAAQRLDGVMAWMGDTVRQEPAEQRGAFLLAAALSERQLYRQRRYATILDSARTVLQIDADNGHALYYAGEAYRHFGDWDNMRDMFQKFISAAAENPGSRTGDARDCYRRPDGYCRERLGFVNHLMALDSLTSASSASGGVKIDALHAAFAFERDAMTDWPTGFSADGRFLSSCDVLRQVSQGLKGLAADATNVDAVAKHNGCN